MSVGSDQSRYIASVVATYWFVSISMVYLNKVLMSNDAVSVPAPLFVTWFQCVATALICWTCGVVADKFKKAEQQALAAASSKDDIDDKKPSFWSQFPLQEFRIGTGRRVFPLSLIFVGMITFNNLCLKWVEVSFYNVARCLTIVFNVFFSQILLGSSISKRVISCLCIVIFGFVMGSKGEVNFSWKGTIAGIMSSLFVSLNSVFTKKVLPAVDNDHWRLTFYNNVIASVAFLPLMILFEWEAISEAFGTRFLSPLFWGAMSVAGFFGFSIGIVTVLQIKATSPLTHNISGTAKAAVQSMLAFYLWGNQWTVMGVVSIFVVLGGSLLYTFVKMDENKQAGAATKRVDSAPPECTASSSTKDRNEDDVEMAKPLLK